MSDDTPAPIDVEGLSKNEKIKASSNHLRGTIAEELGQSAPTFSEDAAQLLKFHGVYQQDDRDRRKEARALGLDKHHQMMIRTRIPGGLVSPEGYLAHDDIAENWANGTLRVTTRQDFQLHGVLKGDLQASIKAINGALMTTLGGCGDQERNIMCCPAPVSDRYHAEVSAFLAELVPALTPSTGAYHEIWVDGELQTTGQPQDEVEDLYGEAYLPRKFKTALSGLQDVAHEINDVAFVGVHHPEHGPGLDVWVGGGLSTNPKIAQRLGAWVPLAEVGEVWEAVVALFRDHGYRRLRAKARLKFLVADWGAEKFRAVLEENYLHRGLIDGPPPSQLHRPRDHVGVQRQKNGLNAVGVSPVAGRVGGTRLISAAAAAERAGSRRVRITPMQKLVVLDVPDDRVEELIAELDAIGLPARPTPWRRATMACTGDEYCKYGIVETKRRAARLIDELEERLADVQDTLESPISIHLNGCPNSCARIQVADIGLKGMTFSTPDGGHEDGFQVHLGGALGFDTTFGRKVRGNKVRSDDLADYIERIVRRYADQRSPGEHFAQWVASASDTDLAV